MSNVSKEEPTYSWETIAGDTVIFKDNDLIIKTRFPGDTLCRTFKELDSLKAENERLKEEYNKLGVKFDKEIERWQERDADECEKRRALQSKIDRVIEYCGNPARGGVSLVDPFVIRGLLK